MVEFVAVLNMLSNCWATNRHNESRAYELCNLARVSDEHATLSNCEANHRCNLFWGRCFANFEGGGELHPGRFEVGLKTLVPPGEGELFSGEDGGDGRVGGGDDGAVANCGGVVQIAENVSRGSKGGRISVFDTERCDGLHCYDNGRFSGRLMKNIAMLQGHAQGQQHANGLSISRGPLTRASLALSPGEIEPVDRRSIAQSRLALGFQIQVRKYCFNKQCHFLF